MISLSSTLAYVSRRFLLAFAMFTVTMVFATNAAATFHTYQIEQIYSNADRSVQFIVFHEVAGLSGQQQLSGSALRVSGSSGTTNYVFRADLANSNTGGTRFLIGSAGFAALGIVTPDYVLPNGFLDPAGNVVNYALVDQVSFTNLPTDGVNALYRDGSSRPNIATNFAGKSASVTTTTAAPNYQGLWYNPAESGWGINFAHQGDLIFASWFTYDLAGKGTWLVMTAGKTTGTTYTGQLLQGTGPSFDASPFPPLGSPGGATIGGLGGTGTVTFTDASNATFTYTLAGITQTKNITRQLFGPQPVCTFGAQANLALATNYTDLWWASPPGSEAGWGINLTHQGDIIFATWFTFDHDHTPRWMIVQANKTAPGVYTGTQVYRLSGPAFNQTPFPPIGATGGPTGTIVGTASFTFANGNAATFSYTVDGVTQSKAITREVFTPPGTVCQDAPIP